MGAGVADSRLVAKVEGVVGERGCGEGGASVGWCGGLGCRRLEVSAA